MIVSEVISRVRVSSGDSSSLQFTDAQIVDWINDGLRECAVQNNLLQKRATSNTVVGQADYALPTDILKMHSVKFDSQKIPVITLEEFDERYSGQGATTPGNGIPTCCYVWAGVLTLFPPPAAVKVLNIEYLYDPPLHTVGVLGAAIGLPVGYHSRIVDYCLAQVAQQDDNLQMYQLKMEEFRTGVQNLKDQPENTYDLYPSISVDSRDMGSGFDSYGDWG